MEKPQPTISRLYEDLRRRKVFRAAAIYGVVAWFAIQAAEATFAPLNFPAYAQRVVVILALAGFPIVLLLAWAYDLTRSGLVRTAATQVAAASRGRERIVDFVIIAVLAALVAYLWVRPAGPTSAGGAVRSIAVLPFIDLSESGDQAYFADGIAEELLNGLVAVEGLRVAARTSSFAFRGVEKDVRSIGEELQVDTVLEGSVRRSGDRVKITAQLIKTEDGYHLWSQDYDRQLTDIFAVQEDISRSIVEELKLHLSGAASERLVAAQPANVRTYERYLEGRHHWRQRTPESLERARELFAEAVQLDPNFAPAFSGLADTYLLLSESQYGSLSQEEVLAHAEPAIARALELDSDLAEAYASLGLLRWSTGELALAQLALRKAVDLNPNYSMAHVWLGSVVMEDESALLTAEQQYRQAYELDPLHIVIASNYASTLGKLGRTEEARALGLRLVEQLPDMSKPYLMMAEIEEDAGRIDEAVRWTLRADSLPDARGDSIAYRAKLLAELGLLDEAREAVEQARAQGADDHITLSVRGFLDLLQGDWADLKALADELAPPPGTPVTGGFASEKSQISLFWGAVARLGLDEAEAALERLARLNLDENPFGRAPDRLTARNAWAFALQRVGRGEEAQAVLTRTLEIAQQARSAGWRAATIGFPMAETQLLLGRRDDALATIDDALRAGALQRWYLQCLPSFDSLRNDPAFRAAIERLDATLARQRVRASAPPDAVES